MIAAWGWLSGRFVREQEALVPGASRSVSSGLGVFETLRVRNGQALLLARHLARLEKSATALGLWTGPFDAAGTLAELCQRNGLDDAFGRITLGEEFAHICVSPLPPDLEEQRTAGIRLPVISLTRALPGLKSTSRIELEMAERSAGGEVLLSRSRNELLETTRANFFAVSERGLETAMQLDVLPGIARQLVLEIAAKRGLAVLEAAPRLETRERWKEAFATNSPRGIRPVVEVDGAEVTRAPGPITLELQRCFDELSGLRP